MEVGLHMLSGNTDAAASGTQRQLAARGAVLGHVERVQNLAQLHMQLYGLAVMQSDNPDYRKGIQQSRRMVETASGSWDFEAGALATGI